MKNKLLLWFYSITFCCDEEHCIGICNGKTWKRV